MFFLLTYLTSMICSTIFSFMQHPLAMGLMLLIQTLLICLISGMISKTFWFSYVLFLIFLGGMLILFIYVTSLASNEMFSFSSKMSILSLGSMFTMIIMMLFIDKTMMLNYMMNSETIIMDQMSNIMTENSLMLNKLYNFPTNLITVLLMIYLFLTLIAVVKITNIFEGPLRPKMN